MNYASALFAVALATVTGCADKAGKDPQTAANANDVSATSTIAADGTAAYPTNDPTARQDAPTPVTMAPTARTTTTELAPPVPSTAGRTDSASPGGNDATYATPAAGPTPGPTPSPSAQDPTNTARNERDAHGGTLTPLDQGGSEADRRVTQKVRQSLIADSGLSFTAKNVKIITIDGKVTLRGPVKSDQERASIEQKAKTTAGVKAVDNQLEIKR